MPEDDGVIGQIISSVPMSAGRQPDDASLIEAMARAIEPELVKQEMVLADPLTLRRLLAERCARAALAALRAERVAL